MNSVLNWNDNLAAIFETKLTFKYQSLSIVFLGAVDIILLRTWGQEILVAGQGQRCILKP